MDVIEEDSFAHKVLHAHKKYLGSLLDNVNEYRFQLVLSQMTILDKPVLFRSGYRVDAEYFYPARSLEKNLPMISSY